MREQQPTAQHARDHRDTAGEKAAQARLYDLVRLRDTIAYPPFEVLVPEDPIQPAMKALYLAEDARCRADGPTSDIWAEAVDRCAAAGMKWQQMVATWRWATALLDQGDSRATAAGPLRAAHRLATDVGALPLRQRLEEFAALAAIRWMKPQPSQPSAPETVAIRLIDRAGAGGAVIPGRGSHLPRDRGGSVHQREDSQHARLTPPPENWNQLAVPSRSARLAARSNSHPVERGRARMGPGHVALRVIDDLTR